MLTRAHCQIIFVISLLFFSWGFFKQGLDSGIEIPHFDKFMHFAIFGWLALFLDKGFAKSLGVSVAVLFVYGAAVEFIQGQWAGREASLADLVADMVGVLVYFTIGKAVLNRHFGSLFR